MESRALATSADVITFEDVDKHIFQLFKGRFLGEHYRTDQRLAQIKDNKGNSESLVVREHLNEFAVALGLGPLCKLIASLKVDPPGFSKVIQEKFKNGSDVQKWHAHVISTLSQDTSRQFYKSLWYYFNDAPGTAKSQKQLQIVRVGTDTDDNSGLIQEWLKLQKQIHRQLDLYEAGVNVLADRKFQTLVELANSQDDTPITVWTFSKIKEEELGCHDLSKFYHHDGHHTIKARLNRQCLKFLQHWFQDQVAPQTVYDQELGLGLFFWWMAVIQFQPLITPPNNNQLHFEGNLRLVYRSSLKLVGRDALEVLAIRIAGMLGLKKEEYHIARQIMPHLCYLNQAGLTLYMELYHKSKNQSCYGENVFDLWWLHIFQRIRVHDATKMVELIQQNIPSLRGITWDSNLCNVYGLQYHSIEEWERHLKLLFRVGIGEFVKIDLKDEQAINGAETRVALEYKERQTELIKHNEQTESGEKGLWQLKKDQAIKTHTVASLPEGLEEEHNYTGPLFKNLRIRQRTLFNQIFNLLLHPSAEKHRLLESYYCGFGKSHIIKTLTIAWASHRGKEEAVLVAAFAQNCEKKEAVEALKREKEKVDLDLEKVKIVTHDELLENEGLLEGDPPNGKTHHLLIDEGDQFLSRSKLTFASRRPWSIFDGVHRALTNCHHIIAFSSHFGKRTAEILGDNYQFKAHAYYTHVAGAVRVSTSGYNREDQLPRQIIQKANENPEKATIVIASRAQLEKIAKEDGDTMQAYGDEMQNTLDTISGTKKRSEADERRKYSIILVDKSHYRGVNIRFADAPITQVFSIGWAVNFIEIQQMSGRGARFAEQVPDITIFGHQNHQPSKFKGSNIYDLLYQDFDASQNDYEIQLDDKMSCLKKMIPRLNAIQEKALAIEDGDGLPERTAEKDLDRAFKTKDWQNGNGCAAVAKIIDNYEESLNNLKKPETGRQTRKSHQQEPTLAVNQKQAAEAKEYGATGNQLNNKANNNKSCAKLLTKRRAEPLDVLPAGQYFADRNEPREQLVIDDEPWKQNTKRKMKAEQRSIATKDTEDTLAIKRQKRKNNM